MQIEDERSWRHLSKKEIERILSGDADCLLTTWSKYHLGKEGHNCKRCKERLKHKKRSD